MRTYFLADDLSGALDAAAAFRCPGRRVRISLSADWTASDENEVVGITTETRNASPAVAAAAVARALARGRAEGARLVYKKIDSTLRGPVAAELAALTAAMPEATILFAPANPRVGRTVRNGVLLVRGVPVAETEFGHDPLSPVRESTILRLLGGAATARVIVADAETDEDLAVAVGRTAGSGREWVGVGSGALARAVAAWQAVAAQTTEPPAVRVPPSPILLIGGSAHPANRAQIDQLARVHGVPVHELTLADPMAVAQGVGASLRAQHAAVLRIEPRRADSSVALAAVTAVATRVVTECGVRRVFATGGDTAFALCRALRVDSLDFRAEIEPGLGLAHGVAGTGPMRLAVKPGGFGDDDTWVRAWQALRED